MGHPSLEELVAEMAASSGLEQGSTERVSRLRALLAECPVFSPALLELAANLQLSDDLSSSPDPLAEIEATLDRAIRVTYGPDSTAVLEKAHFEDAVRDSPQAALELLSQVEPRLRKQMEELFALKVRVLAELEEHARAHQVAAEGLAWFPKSPAILEALDWVEPKS